MCQAEQREGVFNSESSCHLQSICYVPNTESDTSANSPCCQNSNNIHNVYYCEPIL